MESVMVFIRMLKSSLINIGASAMLVGCILNSAVVHAVEITGLDSTTVVAGNVLTGVDVLERDGFKQLAGANIGLITNQTGINRLAVSNIQLLHNASAVNLRAIFSPEHGLFGKLDVDRIENSKEPMTGIKVYSLYGTTYRPTPEMLKGIDTLVFDIQDIGTRFYTYISTMGYAMQAAASNGIRFVVLDRPNPINGITVSGPVSLEGKQSMVGFHRLPVRHGMTIGELAKMFNAELKLDLDLEVIPLEGWRRTDFFDATGLPWINPSPNMRSLTEAILYPGIGLLETTNLSVGRGTDTPFERLGAPWLAAKMLALELNRQNLPGVLFMPLQFTPDSSKFNGELCRGVSIQIEDRDQYESVRTGIEIALVLRRLFKLEWKTGNLGRLLGNEPVLKAIRNGRSYPDIVDIYTPGLEQFKQRRSQYLIYK